MDDKDAWGYPEATPLLLSMDALPPASLPPDIRWQFGAAWLPGDPLVAS